MAIDLFGISCFLTTLCMKNRRLSEVWTSGDLPFHLLYVR